MTPLGSSPRNDWRVSEQHADLVRIPEPPAPLTQLPHFEDFAAPKAAEFLGFSGDQAKCGAKKEALESGINV